MKDKPVFVFGGNLDRSVEVDAVKQTADWFKKQGASVREEYKDYGHTFPNNLKESIHNPKKSCTKNGMINCGDDLTGRFLEFLLQGNS